MRRSLWKYFWDCAALAQFNDHCSSSNELINTQIWSIKRRHWWQRGLIAAETFSIWHLHVLPVPVWIFSQFLQNMSIKLIDDSKLPPTIVCVRLVRFPVCILAWIDTDTKVQGCKVTMASKIFWSCQMTKHVNMTNHHVPFSKTLKSKLVCWDKASSLMLCSTFFLFWFDFLSLHIQKRLHLLIPTTY